LTPNGKVDRKALPAPEGGAYARSGYEAPLGAVEETLAGIWAEVLGVERVGRWDDFFRLGGHSLLALQFVERAARLELSVSLADLFSHPTVESLAACIGGLGVPLEEVGVVSIRPAGTEPPLFLIHDGDGSIKYARVLAPHIRENIPIYAVLSAPGSAEDESVEDMAKRLVELMCSVQPSGPYRMAGWSFGGTLAYEMARQLLAEDREVEFVGLLDTHRAIQGELPQEPEDDTALLLRVIRFAAAADPANSAIERLVADARSMDFESLVQKCHSLALVPDDLQADQVRQVLRGGRRNAQAQQRYAPAPLPTVVSLFTAREDGPADPSLGWQQILPESLLRVISVPGTHGTMMQRPHVAALGTAVSREISSLPRRAKAPPVSPLTGLPV
jgi:thioesterase domain-containing protein